MASNFSFLNEKWPLLSSLGATAEQYVYSDSNSCLIKLGILSEQIVQQMFVFDCIEEPKTENTHANRIKILKKEDLLPPDIESILHALRVTRNKAAHDGYSSFDKAKMLLELAYKLTVWFMQVYGSYNFKPQAFVMPDRPKKSSEYEKEIARLELQLKKLADTVPTIAEQPLDKADRVKIAYTQADKLNLTESETRYLIDEQLRKAGWEADTENIRYSKGTRPEKNKNKAIAEWPTDSGTVDYALFIGLQLVGVVEAKRQNLDVFATIDCQCKDYAKGIKDRDKEYIIALWGAYKVPFLFSTNGRKYIKQLETKSGIWFLDIRNDQNMHKALHDWITPDGLKELLAHDIQAAEKKLKSMDDSILTDKDALNLRPYQVNAIKAAEEAILNGKRTALLAMATGTGKTRTVLGLIYRFIKSRRFRRVLFLVDRNTLGEQAQDVFKEVKLEDLKTLNSIYDIKGLTDKTIDKETKIHVATVQGMVNRIFYAGEDEKSPTVTDYDLIIVDEAHRGYILDQEMTDDEFEYRNQADFVSKYRSVLEYFDSVKIALTATPALHTTEIFGRPVFNYTYREAVIEGYLVDHDAPVIIETKLSSEGILFEQGAIVPILDPMTGEIQNSDQLEDDMKFDIESFNSRVVTESFNRAVLEEISNHLNLESGGKTLIFAVDNQHADMIVNILREIYQEQGYGHESIVKITGAIGDRKRVLDAVKRFKNEKEPRIVVTVELLTTGIDVPEIDTLVFLRRVKSRILFEQMLGRATRLCPAIAKTHFDIFDPVGVYETLDQVNTMKPVVANPSQTFEDLLPGLDTMMDETRRHNHIDNILAKLQRKQKGLDNKQREHFASLSEGQSPEQFILAVKNMPVDRAVAYIKEHEKLFKVLDSMSINRKGKIISDKDDHVTKVTRGYGKGVKPEDYLSEFKAFINNNMNKIPALNIVCQRPKDLTREELKALKLELDRNYFNELWLNSAWEDLKNEEIAADIISFIRQQALGAPLVSHKERIERAIVKIKENHTFNKGQLTWLDRIEKELVNESLLYEDSFNQGRFADEGGFKRMNQIFQNQLPSIIDKINGYLYDDNKGA